MATEGPVGPEHSSPPLVNSVPVLIWVTGDGASGRFFNTAWGDFTGQPLDGLMGDGWLTRMHPDDRAAVVSAHRACAAEGTAFELELRLRGAEGTFHQVLSRGTAERAGGCVAVAIDICERSREDAERRLLLARAQQENARLASLQALTSSLAALTEPAEVAEVVLVQGVAELGATTASLCLLCDDGETLEVAADVGYPTEVTDRWGHFQLASATPAGDATREGAGIYISTLEELYARYPIFEGGAIVGDQALAVLPLTTIGTGPMGAMVFGFAQSRQFSSDERQLLDALAAQASTALARARARVALEAARAQLAFLADASERLAASLDLDQTLATVADLAVPRLADRCWVYLLEKGQVQARLWAPGDPDEDLTALGRHPVTLSDPAGVGAVLRTGQRLFAPSVDDELVAAVTRSEEHHALLRQLGFGAVAVHPLRARGQLFGAMALVNRAGHSMADRDQALADELAARAAVAIDNARLYADQVLLAQRLQASLLPPSLPVIDGLDLAALYAAAGDGAEVGGDFYDCIRLSRNRLLLVVGDVKGKGVDAAVLTGMARHVIRAVASTERRPADILAALNGALFRLESERMAGASPTVEATGALSYWEGGEPRFCTILAVTLTRRGRDFHAVIASAGHPLPLLRTPDGHVSPVGQAGTMLGILPSVDLPQVTLTLNPGALLVCYTDGVSECHNGPRFFDEEGIVAVVAGARGPAEGVTAAIERAARAFTATGEVKDDMAILAVGVLP